MTEWQLGITAFREGRLRETADRLSAAAADQQRTVSQHTALQTFAYLGAALYALGDAAGAAAAFSAAISLRLNPTPPLDLSINLANAYIASGQPGQAEETLSETLRHHPGAMEAKMLLQRLHERDHRLPLTGAVLGESPESVKRYLDTLSFSTVAQGLSPDQVHAALAQIHHYIDVQAARIADQERTIAQSAAEIERLRQAEEVLIETVLQARQEADQARLSFSKSLSDVSENGQQSAVAMTNTAAMTPLEKLFQKKN